MSESVDLIEFVSSMGAERSLRIEENLGEGYVRLRVAEAERRQAKHDIRCIEDVVIEMLRNARDAGAHHIYVATAREGDLRVLTMLDDGRGIPQDMQERVFEARVTSKLESVHLDRWGVHGRGMALYSISENAESARVMASDVDKGASIRVVTNPASVAERADQSSWPTVERAKDTGETCVRGPHNIIRTCCEFALEERGVCEVYLGSAAEIAATARARVRCSSDPATLFSLKTLDELPVLERLHVAADAAELLTEATALGLSMSERTAHRIVAGQVKPLRSVLSCLAHKGNMPSPEREHEVDLSRDRRALKLSQADVEAFSRLMERDFQTLAERYYLSLSDDPKVRVSGRRITVTFDFEERD